MTLVKDATADLADESVAPREREVSGSRRCAALAPTAGVRLTEETEPIPTGSTATSPTWVESMTINPRSWLVRLTVHRVQSAVRLPNHVHVNSAMDLAYFLDLTGDGHVVTVVVVGAQEAVRVDAVLERVLVRAAVQ